MRSFLALAASVGLLSVGCWGGNERSKAATTSAGSSAEAVAEAVTQEGLRMDLTELQRIADENGGTRASGTSGYEASVRYVASQLRKAGYQPRLQRFRYTDIRELEQPELERTAPKPTAYTYGDEFVSLRYSGSGDVEARVQPVDAESKTSGCESSDFDAFERGSVALIRRGGCFFFVKVGNAVSAGASAVIVFNDGSPGHEGPLEATLVHPVTVPAVSLANAQGEELASEAAEGAVQVHLRTSTKVVERNVANVLADLPGATGESPLLLGAHLDSVASGPGINDNGSGVAALVELAKAARKVGFRPREPVRFAFWAGEEAGLVGSTKYVESLDEPQREIGGVINLDMVGSPDAEAFVYEGDRRIEKALTESVAAEGLDPVPIELEGRSDHAPFDEAGVPVGGLFTGADEPAPDGKPHDPCYHRPCDTLENVDVATVERLADALTLAVFGDLTRTQE
jgi:Zn-dependent M28 family amino/carboxypeptidase